MVPVESRKAQLEVMQSSKQSDFERVSARNANALSNPTTFVRARMLTLGRRLRVLPNTKKRARAEISSAKWLRGTPEQRFRAASGYGARPSSDFERKARPVRCFRVLPAWLEGFRLPIRAEDLLYNILWATPSAAGPGQLPITPRLQILVCERIFDFKCPNLSFGMPGASTLASWGLWHDLGELGNSGERKKGHFDVQACIFID